MACPAVLARRSGIILNINVLGDRMDGQMTDERPDTYSGDWNPIWEFRTGRFEQGCELGVSRAVDLPHPSFPDEGGHVVVPEAVTDVQGHGL